MFSSTRPNLFVFNPSEPAQVPGHTLPVTCKRWPPPVRLPAAMASQIGATFCTCQSTFANKIPAVASTANITIVSGRLGNVQLARIPTKPVGVLRSLFLIRASNDLHVSVPMALPRSTFSPNRTWRSRKPTKWSTIFG